MYHSGGGVDSRGAVGGINGGIRRAKERSGRGMRTELQNENNSTRKVQEPFSVFSRKN